MQVISKNEQNERIQKLSLEAPTGYKYPFILNVEDRDLELYSQC
jgi:hypothetical protein